jgi:hypothetical protein
MTKNWQLEDNSDDQLVVAMQKEKVTSEGFEALFVTLYFSRL